MKKAILKLAKNKYVFYFFVVLAVLNILGYVSMRSWECIVMFAAVAYSVNCYAKNGTLALIGGLFVSNFIFGCNRVKENFEETMKHGEHDKDEDKEEDKKHETGDNSAFTAIQQAMTTLSKLRN